MLNLLSHPDTWERCSFFFASASSSSASSSTTQGSAQASARQLYAVVYSSVTVKYPEAQTWKRRKKRKGERAKSRRHRCLLPSESPARIRERTEKFGEACPPPRSIPQDEQREIPSGSQDRGKDGTDRRKQGDPDPKPGLTLCGCASPSAVPGPAVSASPENLLERRLLRIHPEPPESETLGGEAWQSVF